MRTSRRRTVLVTRKPTPVRRRHATILQSLTLVIDRLAGPGATTNARREVDRATAAITDLDTQLEHVIKPSPGAPPDPPSGPPL